MELPGRSPSQLLWALAQQRLGGWWDRTERRISRCQCSAVGLAQQQMLRICALQTIPFRLPEPGEGHLVMAWPSPFLQL